MTKRKVRKIYKRQTKSVREKFLERQKLKKQKRGVKKIKADKKENITRKYSPRLYKGIKKIIFFSLLLSSFTWLFWGIPLPNQLTKNQVPVSTKLFDRNGTLLYEIYADKKSSPVDINKLPSHVREATISIEDKDFYKHYGISYVGIARAVYKIIIKRSLQGGSTLTQQLVKNSLLTPERTIKRKAREFFLTIAVESIYSKDQILSLYLNQIPYGGTTYGIGAAAEYYFGKNAYDLTLAEASLLAGLPQAPSTYSPFGARPELAKDRQNAVLRRMVEDGYINEEDKENALTQELKFTTQENLKAPHFALWIKEQLAEKYGQKVVEQGGLRVTTTLDLPLQEFSQDAVATEVAKLKRQKVGNGTALVTLPQTGEVLAMVGSYDYNALDEDGKVNIIFSQRQPGSSIKPLNYALALKNKKITLSTPLADVPTCFTVVGQEAYCPKNYDGSFHGATQVRYALANSLNIPAVRVLALNGLTDFIDFAKEMGITSFADPSHYGLSLTLGGGEVRPYDMATAFGVFANKGIKQPLISIIKVTDWKGKVLEENKPADIKLTGKKILDINTSFLISHTLSDNGSREMIFGTNSLLNVKGHPEVSVKTGTTNERKDNWTIGYTDHVLVLTWVGNNDNTPMSGAVSGVSGASPIWNTIMKKALDNVEAGFYDLGISGHAALKQPADVVGAQICTTNGNLPSDQNSPGCQTRFEYFLKDNIGAGIQSGSTDVAIDKTTGAPAYSELPTEQVENQNHPFLLDPLGTLVCLDCPIASSSATISYPLSETKSIN